MTNLDKKITFNSDGKSLIEKVFSGKTISEIKSMSLDERQSLLNNDLQNRQAVNTSQLTRRTSYEFTPNPKPDFSSLSSGNTKSVPTKSELTPRPEGYVKPEPRAKRRKETTVYTGQTTENVKQSNKRSINFSVDNSETEFISGTVDYSFPAGNGYGFNGSVYSMAQSPDGILYIGGDFMDYNSFDDYIYSPYLVSLYPDGSINWAFDSSYLNGDVYTIAIQEDGKIIIGGDFNYYNYGPGYSCPRIARLNPDGSFDTTFAIGSGFDNYVNDIKIQPDGKILVGGLFDYYNGVISTNIIRLNSNGSVDSSFIELIRNGKTGFNNEVNTIKLQSDGKILVGGYFDSYVVENSVLNVCNYIARLNSDGSYDTTFNIGNGFSNYVNSIDLQSDGKIIVGGNFWDTGSYNNNPCNSIVRLNTDGSLDSTFGFGLDNEVMVVKVQPNNKILVGGYFGGYMPVFNNTSTIEIDELVRFNADTTFDYSFYYTELFNSAPWAIELQSDGKILIGGDFSNSGQPSVYPLNYFGRLFNTLPDYTYVYSVVVSCPGNTTKTYSVASNTEFSVNDMGKTISFKSLKNEVDVLCGYLSIGFNSDFNITLYPYGTPEYVHVQTYNYGECITCTMDNNKYVRAYNPLSDNYDYFYVNNKFEVGDFFFVNETIINTDTTIRGCFQITEIQESDGSDYSAIPFVPYLTCEECVEANGVEYFVYNWDYKWGTSIISNQYFDPSVYPAIILPNSPTHANFVAGSNTYYGISENKIIPNVFSTPTFLDNDNPIPPYTVAKLMEQKGDGQLNFFFNESFINETNAGFNDLVFVTKEQPDGKILVGGLFDYYNGENVSPGVCRLNSDGTVDTDFNLNLNVHNVYELSILPDESILIGGELSLGLSNPSKWIDQTDGDATITRNPESWTLVGTNDSQFNGWSYVKRQFDESGSITIYYDWFTDDGLQYDNPFYYVSSVEPVGNRNIRFKDNIFVGGDSETGNITIEYNAGDWVSIGVYSDDSSEGPGYLTISEYTHLIKTNKYGKFDTEFNNNVSPNYGFNGNVNTITPLSNGTILVGGDFSGFGYYEVDGFVKLNSNGTINTPFTDTKVYFNGQVYKITVQDDGKILIGGDFQQLYDPTTDDVYSVGYLVRLNSDGSLDFTFNSYTPATFSTETPFSGVTAQYIRWTITNTKDVSESTQVSELYLTLNGELSTLNYGSLTCTNPDGDNPVGEGPEFLVDDNITTKWTDLSFSANGQSVILIDNGIPINFDGYKYYTGNDFSERDPITWTLEISNDNLTWYTVSEVTNAVITNDRETSTQIFSVTPIEDFGGSIYVNNSIIDAYTDVNVWNIGGNDFTFEWFQKYEGGSGLPTLFSYSDTYLSVYFDVDAGTINVFVNGPIYTFNLNSRITNNWHHFAITRNGSTWRVFQNGEELGNFDVSISYGLATPFRVGAPSDWLVDNNNQGFFVGKITNVRVTNDASLYDTNFIPPTQPLTHDDTLGNTVLLLSVLNSNTFINDSSDDIIETSLVTIDTGLNDYVTDIKVDISGNVFVGGDFNYYNNQYIGNGLIKLDKYGVVDTSFNIGDGFSNSVSTIQIQPDGKILVGGFFGYYDKNGGYNSYSIIRLDQEGNPDLKFLPILFGNGFNNPVLSIEISSDGNSIVGGWFSHYLYTQVGNSGGVAKIYTADNFKLTHFDTCENNESNFMYLPFDSSIHTLDNFWSGSEDDANHFITLPLGFNINFLGVDYTEVNISSNTYLSFGNGGDPSSCCFTIPNNIPNRPELPGIYISVNKMDSQLYNLYSGITNNGEMLILKWEGSYHSTYRTDIPNLVVDYIFYKNDPYRIDVVIEQNDHYSNGNPTSGVSDGINPNWLASFSATSQTAWKITDSTTIEPLTYGYVQTSNDILKGNVNTTEAICGTVFGEQSGTTYVSGSNQFSGDDSLIVTNSSDGLYPRTSDFTIEWFQRRIYDENNSRPFSIGTYNNPSVTIAVSFENSTNFTLWLNDVSYNFGNLQIDNLWVHFAITRKNNLIRVFLNGNEIYHYSNGDNTGLPILFMGDLDNQNGDNLTIGNESTPNYNGQYNGLITNFRYIKGNALYTSNFEVPVNPLTPVKGTYVLMLSSTQDTLLENSGDSYFEIIQSNWNGGPTDFVTNNPFDNGYKLFNSNGITHYDDCVTCLDTVMYKSIMYVRDGVNPNWIERHSIKPSVIHDRNTIGPIFTRKSPECYEILNYFY